MRCSSELMAAPGRECHRLSERLRVRKKDGGNTGETGAGRGGNMKG